jgi:hypothetical protein
MPVVNLAQKFSLIYEYWSPKIAGELNSQYVKLASFKGEFVPAPLAEVDDEFFLVIRGSLSIQLRDVLYVVALNEGNSSSFLLEWSIDP